MGKTLKFLQLPFGHQKLLFQALVVVGLIRIGLWMLPFRTVMRGLSVLTRRDVPESLEGTTAEQDLDNRVGWRVKTVSRWIPGATCLTQALATQMLLSRRGQESDLRIGVAKGEGGKLEAHAWVELNGKVIIGKLPDLYRYVNITHPAKRVL
jgi:Transglutaminase-like superfamily